VESRIGVRLGWVGWIRQAGRDLVVIVLVDADVEIGGGLDVKHIDLTAADQFIIVVETLGSDPELVAAVIVKRVLHSELRVIPVVAVIQCM
jgi:hypothetical protein